MRLFLYIFKGYFARECYFKKWLTLIRPMAFHGLVVGALYSNSGVSDQQSVGSSPSCDSCVLKETDFLQDT